MDAWFSMKSKEWGEVVLFFVFVFLMNVCK